VDNLKTTFDPEKKLYTLSILVENSPGVLSQVARLFSRKGYNIESIVSGETDRPGVIRITIVILGDELMISQIAAQCRKLIPVLSVKILDEATSIQREFALIKVRAADRNARDEVIQMANIFRANIIDVSRDCLTVAIFGDKDKTSALIGLLEDFGILEIAKTGTLAIERGRSTIYDDNKLKEEYNYGKNVL
jgi:acetolactate synthase-1/3 small subunit